MCTHTRLVNNNTCTFLTSFSELLMTSRVLCAGGRLSEEELGMLIGHAHARIQQLRVELAEVKVRVLRYM